MRRARRRSSLIGGRSPRCSHPWLRPAGVCRRRSLRPTGQHTRFLAVVAFALAAILAGPATASAANPGDLDPSFGNGGTADYPNDATVLRDVAPYPDPLGSQGFVAAGYRGSDPVLIRLDANGNVDHSFGSGGVFDTRLGNVTQQRFEAVGVDPRGRILVAGSTIEGVHDFFVARFTSGGALDPSYGTGGFRKLPQVSSDSTSRAWDLAVTPGEDVIVVGDNRFRTQSGVFYAARAAMLSDAGNVMWDRLLRLTTDPDVLGGQREIAYAVAQQPDGRIVVAGDHGVGTGSEFGVARLNLNGTTDRGFAQSGGRSFAVGPTAANPQARAVAIDSSGRIVLGGSFGVNEEGGWNLLARLTSAGQLDSGFDGDGLVEDSDGAGGQGVRDLATDAQGRIVAAGYVNHFSSSKDVGVTRYLPSGAFDPSFGVNGKVNVTDPGGRSLSGVADAWGLALQGSRIVVVGHRSGGFAARLFGEPTLDPDPDPPPDPDPGPDGGSGGVAGEVGGSGARLHELVIPKSRRKLAARGVRALASCEFDCTITLSVEASRRAADAMGLSDPLLARGSATANAGEQVWVRARTLSSVRRGLRFFGGKLRLKVSVSGEAP